jgi:hypothetical protein
MCTPYHYRFISQSKLVSPEKKKKKKKKKKKSEQCSNFEDFGRVGKRNKSDQKMEFLGGEAPQRINGPGHGRRSCT